jgi:hypothetical protein
MNKPLFDHDHRYTQAATNLADDGAAAIFVLFQKYIEQGYSPREISIVLMHEVMEQELLAVLGYTRPSSGAV